MKIINNIKTSDLTSQFYFFRILFGVVDIIVNSFYAILIFKTFNNATNIFIDTLVVVIAMWVGFIVGSFLISYLGYIGSFKLSFLLISITSIFIALTLNYFSTLFIVFAILRGFSRGLFWSTHNVYILKEFNLYKRNRTLSNILSFNAIFSIILPLLIGSTLTYQGDYSLIFILGGLVSFLTIIPKWRYNKYIHSKVKLSEFREIIKDKRFNTYSLLIGAYQGIETSLVISFLLIPFLFIKEEFGVGIYMAIFNFISAFLIFTLRNSKLEKSKRGALIGSIINLIGNSLLSLVWTFPMLIIRNILVTLGNSTSKPLEVKLDIGIRAKILGNNINESSIEMNIITESIYTLGRVVVIFLMILGIALSNDLVSIFKVLLVISSLYNILYILIGLRVYSKNKEINLSE